MITNYKRQFLIGGILLLVLIIGIVSYGAYLKEKKIQQSLIEFDEQRPIVMEKSQNAKDDFQKALTFIQNHLPVEIVGYDSYSTPLTIDASPEESTTYFLEQALLNNDISQWIGYFTNEASSSVMNQLQGETLEERQQELQGYMDRMTRGSTLTKLSGYELDDQYYILFLYEDGEEVEVPIEFNVLEEDEVIVSTNVLKIIEKIEKQTPKKR